MEETLQKPYKKEFIGNVYTDRNQSVEKHRLYFNGFQKEFFVSRTGQRACLVAINNGKILFTKQYRFLIDRVSTEIPGGKVDQGEKPAESAIRETFEETGILCQAPKLLIEYQNGLDIFDNYTYIYYSDQIKNMPKDVSEKCCWIGLDDCLKMIASKKIIDNMSIISIFALQNKLAK